MKRLAAISLAVGVLDLRRRQIPVDQRLIGRERHTDNVHVLLPHIEQPAPHVVRVRPRRVQPPAGQSLLLPGSVRAEHDLVFVTVAKDCLARVVEADLRSKKQVRKECVFRRRLNRNAKGCRIEVSANRPTVRESVRSIPIPLQTSVQSEMWIYRIAEVGIYSSKLFGSAA